MVLGAAVILGVTAGSARPAEWVIVAGTLLPLAGRLSVVVDAAA